MGEIVVRRLDAAGLDAGLDDLARILADCVADGASVGFVAPFGLADAARFWRETVRPGVAAGERVLAAAWLDGRMVGTAQLQLAPWPNQAHRADIAKVLTSPRARRRGVARRMMAEIEREAAAAGRWLLVLDTRTGDAAERMYAAFGYRSVGAIPEFARHAFAPRYESTTLMWKKITQ